MPCPSFASVIAHWLVKVLVNVEEEAHKLLPSASFAALLMWGCLQGVKQHLLGMRHMRNHS